MTLALLTVTMYTTQNAQTRKCAYTSPTCNTASRTDVFHMLAGWPKQGWVLKWIEIHAGCCMTAGTKASAHPTMKSNATNAKGSMHTVAMMKVVPK